MYYRRQNTIGMPILIIVGIIIKLVFIGLVLCAIYTVISNPTVVGEFFGKIVYGFKSVTN